MLSRDRMGCMKLAFLLLSAISHAHGNPYCTESNIRKVELACGVYSHGDMIQTCNSIECYLQCMKDGISDCQKTDQFFFYDIEALIVQYRAMCENPEKTIRAQDQCNSRFCSNKYPPGEIKRDDPGFKQQECNRQKQIHSCIPTTLVGPNCTYELMELSLGLQTVQTSLSECGIPQDHQFFKKYGSRDMSCSNPKINSKCFEISLNERVSKCPEFPGLSGQMTDDLAEKACNNLECNLKCYVDAYGSCSIQDKTFIDPKVITVLGRAICDNYQETQRTLKQCPINDRTCSDEFNNAVVIARNHGGNAEDIRRFCSAVMNFKACVDVSVTSSCTASMAKRASSLYKVGESYAACGPQDDDYFTKYGGDVNCDTSGYLRLTPFCITTVLLLVLAMLHF